MSQEALRKDGHKGEGGQGHRGLKKREGKSVVPVADGCDHGDEFLC